MKEACNLASMLDVADLPLGMPVTLLSTPQRRLLTIAHAMLSGIMTRPALIVIEEPCVGLSDKQRSGVKAAMDHPAFAERVSWLGVSGIVSECNLTIAVKWR
jgi:ABC-type branched-subunit amino acid transport system ATPase component